MITRSTLAFNLNRPSRRVCAALLKLETATRTAGKATLTLGESGSLLAYIRNSRRLNRWPKTLATPRRHRRTRDQEE